MFRTLHRISVQPRVYHHFVKDRKSAVASLALPHFLRQATLSAQHTPAPIVRCCSSSSSSLTLKPITMVDDGNTADAAVSSAAAATKEPPTRGDETNKHNVDDGQSKTSDKNDNNNSEKQSFRERKNAQWRQSWKDKKEKKMRKRVDQQQEDEAGNNKNKRSKLRSWDNKYDKNQNVPPHLGSFADETMQKLFSVDINEVPNKQSEEEGSETGKVEAVAKSALVDGSKADTTKNEEAEEEAKIPKRKLAMLLSFLGTDYSGFQINDGYRTLQSEIELGLYRAGIISTMNFGHPGKYSWSNSARTDKVCVYSSVCIK